MQLFNVSARSFRPFNHPTTITALSAPPKGTVIANTTDSGIQFLRLDQDYAPSEHPTVLALTVQPFDEDRILAITSLNRDGVILLEPASMSVLLPIPSRNRVPILENRTAILCASYETRMVVRYFQEGGKGSLELWGFSGRLPEWTVGVDAEEPPLIGRISPTGARLVTYHNGRHQTHICIWDTRNGNLEKKVVVDPLRPAHPLGIEFQSKDEFYIQNDNCRITYDISWSHNRPITRVDRSPVVVPSRRRHYDVDDNHESVVSGSKGICWIPPGYIRSTQSGYCWVGDSLVMVGRDGTLKKIAFKEEL